VPVRFGKGRLGAPHRPKEPSCGGRSSTEMEVLTPVSDLDPKGKGDKSMTRKAMRGEVPRPWHGR
jgi:hypothetical protein